jgi:hypothetical protein
VSLGVAQPADSAAAFASVVDGGDSVDADGDAVMGDGDDDDYGGGGGGDDDDGAFHDAASQQESWATPQSTVLSTGERHYTHKKLCISVGVCKAQQLAAESWYPQPVGMVVTNMCLCC